MVRGVYHRQSHNKNETRSEEPALSCSQQIPHGTIITGNIVTDPDHPSGAGRD